MLSFLDFKDHSSSKNNIEQSKTKTHVLSHISLYIELGL